MENSNEILTAKSLFDLVESICVFNGSDIVFKGKYTINKLVNLKDSQSYRVSNVDNFYLVSKSLGVDSCIYRYASCGSPYKDTINTLEASYNELIALLT